MERSTVVALLVVVGLGGVALWWLFRDQTSSSSVGQKPTTACGGGIMGSIGQFIEGHVDRKNAVAPIVASAYAKAPPSQLAALTNLAGKLSPSNFIENKIAKPLGEAFCKASLPSFGAIANAVENAGGRSVQIGTSQLAAGTVGPVKALGSAANNVVHGNFGDAAGNVYHSVVDGPRAAYSAVKSVWPF